VLSVVSVAGKKNIYPNNKKEIYNDRYKHTRDRLFGLALMVHILQRTGNIMVSSVPWILLKNILFTKVLGERHPWK
jgi:hypothetical protein